MTLQKKDLLQVSTGQQYTESSYRVLTPDRTEAVEQRLKNGTYVTNELWEKNSNSN